MTKALGRPQFEYLRTLMGEEDLSDLVERVSLEKQAKAHKLVSWNSQLEEEC